MRPFVLYTTIFALAASWAHARNDRGGGLAAADTNRDGSLSLAEWLAVGRQERGFVHLDINRDGNLSREELRATLKLHGRGGQQGQLAPAPASTPAIKVEPAQAGPFVVTTALGEWRDAARGRTVPYKLYYAAQAKSARPVVIFSHGLGGSREGSAFVNAHLASHGYTVVALQHPGSDSSLLRGSGDAKSRLARGANAQAAESRFRDIPFALDRLAELNNAGPLKGALDLGRIGMSGHSFGAVTTQVAIGERVGPGSGSSLKQERIKAAILYSPSKPQRADASEALRDVTVPILHFTGTKDGNMGGLGRIARPADRIVPFNTIKAPNQYLIVLTEGDHMVFSGRRMPGDPEHPQDEAHRALIQQASLMFWNAYLKDDDAARAWLSGPGLAGAAAGVAKVEVKAR